MLPKVQWQRPIHLLSAILNGPLKVTALQAVKRPWLASSETNFNIRENLLALLCVGGIQRGQEFGMETGTITVLDGFPILLEIDGEVVMLRQEMEGATLSEFLAELETEGWTVQSQMPPVTDTGRYKITLVKP